MAPGSPRAHSEQAGIRAPGIWAEKSLLTTESPEAARSFWEPSSEVMSPAAESILESAPQWAQYPGISCAHPECPAIAMLRLQGHKETRAQGGGGWDTQCVPQHTRRPTPAL